MDVGRLAASTARSRLVRAELIRELLLGRRGDLDPRGVRLARARIVGELDLDMVHAVAGLWLNGCAIDKQIRAKCATLPYLVIQASQCAGIDAYGIRVNGPLLLWDGVRIAGSGERGTVDLTGAHIGADFEMTDVEVISPSGVALNASNIRVEGGLYIRRGGRIAGRGVGGAINLTGAHIAGDVYLEDMEVSASGGPAVSASRIHIDGLLFVRGGIRLIGDDEDGIVNLIRARVDGFGGGVVDLKVVAQPGAVLLNLWEMEVKTTMSLPPGLVCPDRGQGATCEHLRRVRLDGLSYAALGQGTDWREWLHLIRCHTPAYHASAYQSLAAVERAAGHDSNVRRILIAQQDDLRRRSPDALTGRLTRSFHWLWGLLAGYGYRARRTAAALLLVFIVAGAMGWWAGQVNTRPGHHAAERVLPAGAGAAASGVPCSSVELVGLGLDRGLPLATTGVRGRCDLDTTSRRGQAFTVAIWGVQLAVWGLATLALAGYTNLVRKTS
ncbi:hypothetical protein LX90_000499 [Lentzea flava]|nr:hypothetical protein [Lentzea flava]